MSGMMLLTNRFGQRPFEPDALDSTTTTPELEPRRPFNRTSPRRVST